MGGLGSVGPGVLPVRELWFPRGVGGHLDSIEARVPGLAPSGRGAGGGCQPGMAARGCVGWLAAVAWVVAWGLMVLRAGCPWLEIPSLSNTPSPTGFTL